MLAKLLAIGAYVAALVTIGVLATRRTRTLRDYYAGGKQMGFFAVAFSARATGESAWLLLGVTGFGALYGVKGFWIVLGELIGVAVSWLFLASRFKRLTDRYDSVTVPDYLESRFGDTGHALRLVAAAALVIFVPIYVSSQIHATGIAFVSFLDINYYLGALIGFGVVLFYITRGGFIAVVWSDVFQGSLMVLGLALLPLLGVLELGGITNLLEVLRTQYPDHLSLTAGQGLTPISLASIAGLMAIGLGFMGSPQVFVRYISLRSDKEVGRGALVAIVWTILADSGAVCIGIVGRALLTGDLGVASEDVLSLSVERLLHPFVAGLYIAAVLSAIMSTIDSLLVVASSAAIRDYYQKIIHTGLSDEDAHRYSSYLTAALSFVALGLAMLISVVTKQQGVFWLIIFGWSGIAATFCPAIILSLFWPRMTARGAIAGMLTGFVAIPFFKFAAPQLAGIGPYFGQLEEMAPSFLVSGIVVVAVSLLDTQSAEKAERAREDLRAAAG
jgi:sodium/proline symporter